MENNNNKHIYEPMLYKPREAVRAHQFSFSARLHS